jgi:propanediol dehydratase large subunit
MIGEAMAMDPGEVARMLVDINVPRERLERLARGMTPAKLVAVVSRMSALEITFAYSKMRQRRTPGNQAHVTNAKDDPLQLAADAAVAVALGFDEIETTMRVASNAWANAIACAVGASVGRGGVLFQCSIEEAEELRIGMAGFTSYAETVSVYGTEAAFVDGDDTPWSKAFLTAAYASRGIKARCTSGASAELLMGFHEQQSVLYLEARCLCLQRAMGVQGTQNGGIDGAPLTVSMAGGMRELMAENLIAVWLGLECASGNDTRVSESEIRVGAKITPYLLAGSDLLCSGMGSILKYDNSFNPSLFNGEDIEDFLALQRDFEADGGLTPIQEGDVRELRMRAIRALAAVFQELGLANVPEAWMQSRRRGVGLARDGNLFHRRGHAHQRCHSRSRTDSGRRGAGAGEARFRSRSGKPAFDAAAADFRRLSADLRHPARRQGHQRAQRSQRLPGAGQRLPDVGGPLGGGCAPCATCRPAKKSWSASAGSTRPRNLGSSLEARPVREPIRARL